MKGFIYRLGVALKDAGERMAHKRYYGAGTVIKLGLSIRDWALVW